MPKAYDSTKERWTKKERKYKEIVSPTEVLREPYSCLLFTNNSRFDLSNLRVQKVHNRLRVPVVRQLIFD